MSNYSPEYGAGEHPKLAQLKVAAILLLVAGGLAVLGNVYFIWSVASQAAEGKATPPPGNLEPGFEGGFYIGFYLPLVLGVIALPLLAFMMFGAIAMLKRRGLGMARAGGILAVIPLTASCCCILTLPFGIWILILLAAPEVKAAFQTAQSQ